MLVMFTGKGAGCESAAVGKQKKASRKERAKAKKLQKRLERTAGSDDEGVTASGPLVKVRDPALQHLLRSFMQMKLRMLVLLFM